MKTQLAELLTLSNQRVIYLQQLIAKLHANALPFNSLTTAQQVATLTYLCAELHRTQKLQRKCCEFQLLQQPVDKQDVASTFHWNFANITIIRDAPPRSVK